MKVLLAVEGKFWCREVELSCGEQKRNGRITYFKVRKWRKEEATEEKENI